jgi:hypothetical protein
MQSKRLAVALAAIAALLALVPAGALAKKHRRHRHSVVVRTHAGTNAVRHCHLSLYAAPRFISSGETALAFGVLACPSGTSVSGQAVTIFRHSAGTGGFSNDGSATTDAVGRFQLTTSALLTNSTFYATAAGAKSAHRAVKVSAKVSLIGPPDGAQLFTGSGPFIHSHLLRNGFPARVTFSGTVSPADVGAVVVLQREGSVGAEEWRRIDRSIVKAGGVYSITHVFHVAGDANIRVLVRSNRLNARSASESLSYEIVQAQNPALTIFSSENPISYGAPVTISGTSASGAGTTLTLYARSRPQKAYAAVATTVTTAGGAYAFAPQTPLVNTVYRVSGGGRTSAALLEGVKYLLTANVAATTVQAGTPLTFSGTVTPAVAGHPVNLQVQNPSGIGYHLVAKGAVSPAGTYSIAHVPFSAGTRKFRIRVPGDPAHQGIASQPFVITITPAALARLKPEPPHNVTLPSEGHV